MTTSTDPGLAAKLFLIFAHVLPALAITALVPILPAIETDFSQTPSAPALVRGLLSSFSVAMIVGSLGAGALGARFGVRRSLFAAIVIYAFAGAAGAFMPGLHALVATRFVLGLATAVIATLVIALTANSFEGHARDKWMGWLAATATIGALLIMPTCGLIGSFGWRYVFMAFLIALPILFLLNMGFPATGPIDRQAGMDDSAHVALPKLAWLLAPLAIGVGAVINATPMYVPFHLAQNGTTDPNAIAFAMLVNASAGVLGALAYGSIRRFLAKPLVFALSFVVGSAGFFLVAQAQTYTGIVLALIFVGVGLGLCLPNLNALASSIGTPAQAAKTIGLATACFFAGGPVLQFFLESLAGGAPPSTSLLLIAGFAAALGMLWLFTLRLFSDQAARSVAE